MHCKVISDVMSINLQTVRIKLVYYELKLKCSRLLMKRLTLLLNFASYFHSNYFFISFMKYFDGQEVF